MHKSIRFISLIGVVVCFALSTADLDINKDIQEELIQQDIHQTAYQEPLIIE